MPKHLRDSYVIDNEAKVNNVSYSKNFIKACEVKDFALKSKYITETRDLIDFSFLKFEY